MPTQTSKITYSAMPRRFIRRARLFWMAMGIAAVLGIAAAVAQLTSQSTVGSYHGFAGTLRPGLDPMPVELARGVILEDVSVVPGDTVFKGQTLASLDVEAMTAKIAALQADLLHHSVLKHCLLADQKPGTPDVAGMKDARKTAMLLALEECGMLLDARVAVHVDFDARRAPLVQQKDLIQNYIRLLTSTDQDTPDTTGRAEDARRALALAMVRGEIDTRLAELDIERRSALSELRERRLDRVRALERDIDAKTREQAALRDGLAFPRIAAPVAGEVVRVRNLVQSGPTRETLNLIQIRPPGDAMFNAHFEVPLAHFKGITLGQNVRLRVVGQLNDHGPLTGQITDLETLDSGTVRVLITLDSASQAELMAMGPNLSLWGQATSSRIDVQLDRVPLLDALGTSALAQTRFSALASQWMLQLIQAALDTATPDAVTQARLRDPG